MNVIKIFIFLFHRKHLEVLRLANPNVANNAYELKKIQLRSFPSWFREEVKKYNGDGIVKYLAVQPDVKVDTYKKYDINGYRYRCFKSEKKTSGSGVMLDASTVVVKRDGTIVEETKPYYGIIQEILELNYHEVKFPLFRCFFAGEGKDQIVKKDGLTLVNFTKARLTQNPDDPFILATHARQVFYSSEINDEFCVVMRAPPRGILIDDDVIDDSLSLIDVSTINHDYNDNGRYFFLFDITCHFINAFY